MKPLDVWSCGGGVQSTAIAVLILQGKLSAPDHIVMVDTERERTSTWRYWHTVLYPSLYEYRQRIHVVKKSDYATVDLWGGEDGNDLLLPAWTNQSGTMGQLPTYCSNEWKRRVAERYIRRILEIDQCCMWIGFSRDEMRRVRAQDQGWCIPYYPLITELPRTRQECRGLVAAYGWPDPPHSSCWMCPHHSDAEWLDIRENDPQDFMAAVELEREFQRRDPHAFLHRSCVPLDQVVFESKENHPLLKGCTGGQCYV